MDEIELLIGLLGVVAAIAWLARALGVPYPIFLVLAGVGIGFVPGLPRLELDPEVIFLVFLPPLVHAAAWSASPRQLRANARTVGLLAVGLVLVTTVAVAVAARVLVPGLSWGPALVLGAIVSPTDTVAATAIFRRLGVPERLVSIVEGESLINDGAALVVYRVAVGAVATGVFSVADGIRDLVLVGAGGVLLGLAVGVAIAYVRRRIDDATIEITITLLTPYLAFLPAEELGLSGVLAAVSSGLYLGWRQAHDFSPSTRLQAVGFWNVLVFVLESVLFILIGLQVPAVLEALSDQSAARLAMWAAAVALVVILVRLAFQFTVGEVEHRWDRRRGQGHPLGWRQRAVLGWSGMRGAVSLAAALAIPQVTESGAPFPGRELILFLVLSTIGITLLLQGLTLPLLVRRLGIEEEQTSTADKALARFQTVEAALARIGDLSLDPDVPRAAVERAREMYATRAQQLSGACRTGLPDDDGVDVGAWNELRRRLVAVERTALLELRAEGAVNQAVIREVERDLDLEDERLQRAAPATNGAASDPKTRA